MACIPQVKVKDGQAFVFIYDGVILKRLDYGFWSQIGKFPLLDYLEKKYWDVPLDILNSFSRESRYEGRAGINKILKNWYRGAIW